MNDKHTNFAKLRSTKWIFVYKLFTFAQPLALLIVVSVSLVRDNLRGLSENLKHKIRPLATHLNAPMPHQGQPQQDQPQQQQQPQQPHPVQVPTPGLEEPKFHLTLPTSLPPVSLALPQVKFRPCQWNLKKTNFSKGS